MAVDNLALRRRCLLLLRRQRMNTSTPKAKHVAAPPATAMPTISPVVSLACWFGATVAAGKLDVV
jgi:hypothetical protein